MKIKTILRLQGYFFYFALITIAGFNLLIRFTFIEYGFITTDEGIALNNSKLAYEGYIPFVSYNGWNSLIHDYISGIPRLFLSPTIFTQRIYGLLVAFLVFFVTLKISSTIGNRRQVLLSAVFLTFGSLTYTYFSNIFYSTQSMTLFLLLAIYFYSVGTKKPYKFVYDIFALISITLTALDRSQALPAIILVWFGLLFLRKVSLKLKIYLTVISIILVICAFVPFFALSVTQTVYALFWPFFAGKILLYVSHESPRSLTKIISFVIESAQDYGLLLSVIISFYLVQAASRLRRILSINSTIIISSLIVFFFIFTAVIHQPADAGYIYPSVPLIALISAYFLDFILSNIGNKVSEKFILCFIVLLLVIQAILYPHFKVMKTSLSTIKKTPHNLLKNITNFIEDNSNLNDEIITFYLPAIANTSRKVPINLNEGPGSISIQDTTFSQKFHLTNINMLQDYIATKKAKLIVFTDTFVYYFGANMEERQRTLKTINEYYKLVKEFPEFHLIDGSKAKSLVIYRRKD